MQSPIAPRDHSLRRTTTVKHIAKAARFVGEAIWNDLWTSKRSRQIAPTGRPTVDRADATELRAVPPPSPRDMTGTTREYGL